MSSASSDITHDDAMLVARMRTGDRDAFATLFRSHYVAACEYAERFVRDAAQAEDLAQAVFARMLEYQSSLTITHSVRGYVLRAVRREALHALRRRRVADKHAVRVADTKTHGDAHAVDDPASLFEARDVFEAVENAANALPPRTREAFLLRWRYELKYDEIAETMGISVKTVEMQLSRAFKSLRERLARRVGRGDAPRDGDTG